jgi:hypothetical protein
MTQTTSRAPPVAAPRALLDGLLASLASGAMLLWRGRADTGRAWPPINAISHWLWPREAMRRDDASLKHTLTGAVVHYGSSVFWALAYRWLRSRRRHASALNAASDAAAVTALAAVVDLALVPKRLTPGFEQRLTRPSLALVYAGFAFGLTLGGLLARRR